MPTIYDIAKKAGVSPATVSKVFNNYSQVNEKTKEKVHKIAKEMGYVTNLTAQSLKTNHSFLVGVVFSENVGIGLDHHFFSVLLEHFRYYMGNYGYDTIFINNTLGNKNLGYLDHCKYRNVDGAFIITALPDDINMSKLLESKIKCVTTDMLVDNIPYVMSNNFEGAKMAVEYFLNNGHTKIAHIAGPLNTMSAEERLNGYKAGLKQAGIDYNDQYVVQSKWYKFDDAYKATIELLENLSCVNRPTAIFVASDVMALAAVKAIKSKGLEVPKDISIIGFDDIELAGLVSPALTTIRQDTHLIGKTIADTLYNLIVDKNIQDSIPRTPVQLVIRETVRTII